MIQYNPNDCIPDISGNCQFCHTPIPPNAHRNCKERPFDTDPKTRLLGDRIESILGSWKITPENYVAAKAWLWSMPPEEIECNCDERKENLNKLHQKWLDTKAAIFGIFL